MDKKLLLRSISLINVMRPVKVGVLAGWSVILQGIFLFIHDNVFHFLHLLNFRKCKPFLEGMLEAQLAWRREEQSKNSVN